MKKLLLAVLFVLVWSCHAQAQVATRDSFALAACSDTVACTTSTTLNIPLTVAGNSNRALLVGVTISCGGVEVAGTVTGIAWNTSEALSVVPGAELAPVTARSAQVWKLNNPTATASNAIVTFAAAPGLTCSQWDVHAAAVSVYNTSGTLTSSGENSGDSTSATLTSMTSGASDLGFGFVCAGNGLTSTTETSLGTAASTDNSCGSFGLSQAAAGDTSWSWTIPSDSWIFVGVVLQVAGGGGGDTPTTQRIGTVGVGR